MMVLKWEFNPFTGKLDAVQDVDETITFNSLSDVTISSPSDKDSVWYDSGSGEWVNGHHFVRLAGDSMTGDLSVGGVNGLSIDPGAGQAILDLKNSGVRRASWFYDPATKIIGFGTYTDAGAWGGYALQYHKDTKTFVVYGDTGFNGKAISNVTNTNWDLAYSHISADGSSHSYINQDVSSTASPSFVGATISGDIKEEIKCSDFTILNPNSVYGVDTQVFIMWAKSALTITKLQVELDTNSQEVEGDLKYADDFQGLANSVVINDFDTTGGKRTDTSITSGSVAAGKAVYLEFDSEPDVDIKQMHVHIEWKY